MTTNQTRKGPDTMSSKRPPVKGWTGLYAAKGPVQQWLCHDTVAELRGTTPRTLPTRPAPAGIEATWSDFLAGGGGSTRGIFDVPGAGVTLAVNHWPLAVETHNANFPDTDHDIANVRRPDPRRYRGTDFAWFSPECTTWTQANGLPCDYDQASQQLTLAGMPDGEDWDTPEANLARWRSRMQMIDVFRFAEVHRYRGMIVENVPDILKWFNFDRWLADMASIGYRHKVITLNSAFASLLGLGAPQLRDRVYIVFWQKKYRTPNWRKWLTPKALCPSCGELVAAVYTPKPGKRRPMRFGSQYVYRCPKAGCKAAVVMPLVLPAAAAIDFSLPTQRIGDRKTPLAAATRARVEAGIRKYWSPFLAETAGHTFERRPGVRTRSVGSPMSTQSTTATTSLACPALMVPTGGTWNDDAATVDGPMRTRTTRENEALVCSPFLSVLRSGRPRNIPVGEPMATVVADGSGHALIVPTESRDGQRARSVDEPLRTQTGRHDLALVVPLRNNGVAQPVQEHPLATFAAAGTHHALVMRNNTARGDQGQMSTGLDEPLRTVTTAGHQSLIEWGHLLYGYDSGDLRPLSMPMPTQTTVQGDGLLAPAVDVDDCTLRMLAVKEIQAGMAFPGDYVLLGTAQRDKVRMLGNAVTPCAARDLAACLMEAITGVEFELAA